MDTSDSFAYVRFVSDGSGNAAGFSLTFEASVEGMIIEKKIMRRGLLVAQTPHGAHRLANGGFISFWNSIQSLTD